ncbi:MAG: hypothetical protein ABSH09_18965 [Bryobacteraceae bacterium]|jgi:hypothetical protein
MRKLPLATIVLDGFLGGLDGAVMCRTSRLIKGDLDRSGIRAIFRRRLSGDKPTHGLIVKLSGQRANHAARTPVQSRDKEFVGTHLTYGSWLEPNDTVSAKTGFLEGVPKERLKSARCEAQ